MKSVADLLRDRTRAQVLAMSVAERIALALELGDDDLERFRRSSGLSRDDALRHLRDQRQRGRVRSACGESRTT